MAEAEQQRYVAANTGTILWGPGDSYTFLITGAESGGKYFVLDCLVGPGGGPPPHLHQNEDESFYVLEGAFTVSINGEAKLASAGDFVYIPRGTLHGFKNDADGFARMLATFSPAGMEGWFLEAYEPAPDRVTPPPPPSPEMLARMGAAAAKYGVVFV
jgi:quercetin dioxygenase-like cupin family protein